LTYTNYVLIVFIVAITWGTVVAFITFAL